MEQPCFSESAYECENNENSGECSSIPVSLPSIDSDESIAGDMRSLNI